MMLELSPDDTAAKASASSIPAFSSTSRSNPKPSTRSPANSGLSRLNAVLSMSIYATSWPIRDGVPYPQHPPTQRRAHPAATHDNHSHLRSSRPDQPQWPAGMGDILV